jgi:Raf kinase inhibitor-like YbhB/YbcL family protein
MTLLHDAARLAGKLLTPLRAGDDKLATVAEGRATKLTVTTSAFVPGGPIPARHAGEQGIAPALAWGDEPAGTKEFVVLCEDPDAPFPKPFVHWVVYGIPPTTRSLPEGITEHSVVSPKTFQGKNSTGGYGFTGPKPPPGHGVHHYHFQVFALDEALALGLGADRDILVEAMRGHVLASGETVGTYEAE